MMTMNDDIGRVHLRTSMSTPSLGSTSNVSIASSSTIANGNPPPPPPRSRRRPPTRALSHSKEDLLSPNSPSPTDQPQQEMLPKRTKRQHALLELLSSERAYASDLILIREIHIPLALGRPVSIVPSSLGLTSSPSQDSSSRSVSTASASSSSTSSSNVSSNPSSFTSASSSTALPGSSIDLSSDAPSNVVFDPSLGPPMTPEDTKIIFSNIAELAVLADLLSDGLEEAMGDLIEGGKGEDQVGELFLRVIPDIEKPYTQYITRHPTALAHLHAISNPASPALSSYLTLSRLLSNSLTHAWDLQSLLIKPVQRLLKYSLLLNAILEETPDGHSDKANLLQAKTKIENVARTVNEERRKTEVIRGILGFDENGTSSPSEGTADRPMSPSKKPSLMMGIGVNVLPPSVMLKTLRTSSSLNTVSGSGALSGSLSGGSDLPGPSYAPVSFEEDSTEAVLISQLHNELRQTDIFAQQLAKDVMVWQAHVKEVVEKLKLWALSFARVLGLNVPAQYLLDPSGLDNLVQTQNGTGESEAFNAFLALVSSHLIPLCATTLQQTLTNLILAPLSLLLQTLKSPYKLISTMSSLAPYHTYLLNMPLSPKNRPPPSLLSASKDYIALRSILARELPNYVTLMRSGMAVVVKELAKVQEVWWADVKNSWKGLWDCLCAEGEGMNLNNSAGDGTIETWYSRYSEVTLILGSSLKVLKPLPKLTEKERRRELERERERVKELEKREKALKNMLVSIEGSSMVPSPHRHHSHHQHHHSQHIQLPEELRKVNSEGWREERRKRDSPHHEMSRSPPRSPSTAVAVAMLSSLTPAHPASPPMGYGVGTTSHGSKRRGSSSSSRSRPRHTSNASADSKQRLSSNVGSTIYHDVSEGSDFEDCLDYISNTLSTPVTSPTLAIKSSKTSILSSGSLKRKGSLKDSPTMYDRPSSSLSQSRVNMKSQTKEAKKEEKERKAREEKERKELKEKERKERKEREREELKASTKAIGQDIMFLDMGPLLPQKLSKPSMTREEKMEKKKRESASHHGRRSLMERFSSSSSESKKKKGKESISMTATPTTIPGTPKSDQTIFFTPRTDNGELTPSTARFISPAPFTQSPISPAESSSSSSSWNLPPPASPTLYQCVAVFPCHPPPGTSYQDIPFLDLEKDHHVNVLEEAGHPRQHPDLPLYVDDGDDCLLLCTRGAAIGAQPEVGWALASFLQPL